ncbi:hypothetical protein LWC35_25830 [Pseudonocardia kujensis]|uniref:hypothetical protein n=1 Tax=Pseudonocardia kujensis TaxID=1128675 RepID=UPI001E6047B1|nr:hypothetical protein [Pseudonocardia kujensis]MCE0766295.1 hypothetical protein [Pseudonocardia kujensis]
MPASRPVNAALGIAMDDPGGDLVRYTAQLRDWFAGLPTFVGDDLPALRDLARQNLGLYTTFPFFRRMWRSEGFVEETDRMAAGEGGAALSDRLLDSFCLLGPVSRCRERLARYREAGVELPILVPPVGPGEALAVIDALLPT